MPTNFFAQLYQILWKILYLLSFLSLISTIVPFVSEPLSLTKMQIGPEEGEKWTGMSTLLILFCLIATALNVKICIEFYAVNNAHLWVSFYIGTTPL